MKMNLDGQPFHETNNLLPTEGNNSLNAASEISHEESLNGLCNLKNVHGLNRLIKSERTEECCDKYGNGCQEHHNETHSPIRIKTEIEEQDHLDVDSDISVNVHFTEQLKDEFIESKRRKKGCINYNKVRQHHNDCDIIVTENDEEYSDVNDECRKLSSNPVQHHFLGPTSRDMLQDTNIQTKSTDQSDDSDVDVETVSNSQHSIFTSKDPTFTYNSNRRATRGRGKANHQTKKQHRSGIKRKTPQLFSDSYDAYNNTSDTTSQFHNYAISSREPLDLTKFNTIQSSKRNYKQRQRNLSDFTPDDLRHHHNYLERTRRGKLRDCFIALQSEIPSLLHIPSASKVSILNEATSFITQLEQFLRTQDEIIRCELLRKQLLKQTLQLQLRPLVKIKRL